MSEWITHNGGPRPVSGDAVCRVLLRDGSEQHVEIAGHWQWEWHRYYTSWDIVAYRISEPVTTETKRFRQGRRVPRNVYDGDEPLFVAISAERAAEYVKLLNGDK